jgi:hypothetical protein
MPRHMLPQVGTTVWFFADPTRRPQAAIVTKRTSYSQFNLSVLIPAGTASGIINVPFLEVGQKPASGQFCTPTGIQDEVDGSGDTTSLTQRASSVAVTAGGTGYTVGDTLTLPANTGPVVLRVTTAAGGIISAVSIVSPGNAVKPGPAPAQSCTGGTGTAATFTITWADN